MTLVQGSMDKQAGRQPEFSDNVETLVTRIIERLGKTIVLGAPLGLGKPVQLVNAFYQRAVSDPSLQLRIVTALSLEKPSAHSPVEAKLLNPLSARLFGNYPGLDYMKAIRKNALPANVQVSEFYFKAGSMKGVASAQQDYISCNYTHVARDLIGLGVNVLVQMVAAPQHLSVNAADSAAGWSKVVSDYVSAEGACLSLSCNPDVSIDLLPRLEAKAKGGFQYCTVGHVHAQLPYMVNDAEVPAGCFDYILADDKYNDTLFAPPNTSVPDADYVAGLYASSLIPDGATLQIGIGSLSDAIAYSCILRQKDNPAYQAMLRSMPGIANLADSLQQLGDKLPFDEGLYVSSEMLVNGFMHMYREGVIKRKVFDHLLIQQTLNEGTLTERVSAGWFRLLRARGVVQERLTQADLEFLQYWGFIVPNVVLTPGDHPVLRLEKGSDQSGEAQGPFVLPAVLSDDNLDKLVSQMAGCNISNGHCMHGGFFLGPRDFYDTLRALSPQDQACIAMSSIGRINQLGFDYPLYSAQRKSARFINTGMMVTLGGAVVSDGLENGTVISGVGGQYNFVAMAHELEDARSIICIRSTRGSGKDLRSNIVSHYGHTTIPRHLRDIVVTEYGIADLRAKTDQEIIIELIKVADSRFQDELIEIAKSAGKLASSFVLDPRYANNRPELVSELLSAAKQKGLFPLFPLGTDLTEEEIALARTLREIKAMMDEPGDVIKSIIKSVIHKVDLEAAEPYLERIGLLHPDSSKELLLQQLLLMELEEHGYLKPL